ncbi:MAG: hypothetical protein CTY31_02650 [Hyphomicrobium sp.]|nr:MAG: hypothetical protein CTY31_02650 [Hyphomicrobium sp.]
MDVSNGQRAFWMVLITSLAAPFFASVAAAVLTGVGAFFDFALPAPADKTLGETAVGAFIWSAFPATVAALALTPFVLQHGRYSWLAAAVAGVLAFTAASIIMPFGTADIQPLMPFFAFLAGLIAIIMRAVLIRAKVLQP